MQHQRASLNMSNSTTQVPPFNVDSHRRISLGSVSYADGNAHHRRASFESMPPPPPPYCNSPHMASPIMRQSPLSSPYDNTRKRIEDNPEYFAAAERLSRSMQRSMNSRNNVKQQGGIIRMLPGVKMDHSNGADSRMMPPHAQS